MRQIRQRYGLQCRSPQAALPDRRSRSSPHPIARLRLDRWSLLQVAVAATFLTGMSGIFGNHFISPMRFWSHFPFYNAPWLVTLITVVTVARAILSGATGVALLSRSPWARTLALVAAFFTIFKPLTGTGVAIYTFWVLMPAASRAEYEAISLPT